MAALYNEELTGLLDRLLPARQLVRQPRPSDPCFDKTCRDEKRLTRRLNVRLLPLAVGSILPIGCVRHLC
jgi:hypothetical protein